MPIKAIEVISPPKSSPFFTVLEFTVPFCSHTTRSTPKRINAAPAT